MGACRWPVHGLSRWCPRGLPGLMLLWLSSVWNDILNSFFGDLSGNGCGLELVADSTGRGRSRGGQADPKMRARLGARQHPAERQRSRVRGGVGQAAWLSAPAGSGLGLGRRARVTSWQGAAGLAAWGGAWRP